MAVRAGSAYVKIDADFSQFDRELRAKLHERLTQQVHVKADASGFGRAEQQVKSFTSHTDKAHFSVGQLGSGLRSLYGAAAKITAVGLGAQAISALGAAGAEAVTSLAPLAGAVAAVPALASAGAQGMGVWKLAFAGVSTAVGGLNQQINKNSQAWKDLTPEGKKFAEQLQAMKKPLQDLSETAQKGLMPGLQEGIEGAIKNLPILRKEVGATAKVIGGLATEAGKLVGSKGFGRDLQTQMERNDVTIKRLGESGLFLFDAIRHITLAAGPLVDWMTRTTLAVSKNIDAWAKAGRESGRFNEFFKETRHVMTDVGHLAVNLGTGLFNIFKDAYPAGRNFLDVQVKLSDKFKEWTKSTEGQNKIKQFFVDAQPAIDEAQKLVGAIVLDFGKLGSGTQVAPLLRTLRVDLLPRLVDMANATTRSFGKPFLDALGQVVTLFTNLGGSSGALTISAQVIGTTVRAVNNLLDVFPVLKPVIASVVVIGSLAKILKVDAAISGMRTLIGLMRQVPGVNIPAIGGGGAKGGGGLTSLLGKDVSMLKPVPVFVVGGNFGGGVGGATIKELRARQGSGRSPAQVAADEAAIAGMSGGGVGVAEKEATGITSKLGKALAPRMAGLGLAAGGFLAASLASTVAGQVVGGKAGEKISSIGNNAALWGGLGASIGTLIAPGIGTAIGGAGGALVGVLTSIFHKHAPDWQKAGAEIAANVNKGIVNAGGVDLKWLDPQRADVEKRYDAAGAGAVDAYNKAANRKVNEGKGRFPVLVSSPDRKEMDKQAKTIVDNFYGSFATHIAAQKFFTPDTFMRPVRQTMSQLPRELRTQMGAAMVASARELERQGRLPRNASAKVARDIEKEYGIVIPGMGDLTRKSVREIARQFDRDDAVRAAGRMQKRITRDFSDLPQMAKTTGKNMSANYVTELDFLADRAAHSTGRAHKTAVADFQAVARSAKTNSHDAQVNFVANLDQLRIQGGDKSKKTKQQVLAQFDDLRKKSGPKFEGIKNDAITAILNLQAGVVPTGNSTAVALYQAFQAMGINANQLAKALGIDPIELKLTAPAKTLLGAVRKGKVPTLQAAPAFAAGGGLLQIGEPGLPGLDNVPLNVGGVPVLVGEGEQVAVFNRHQAPIMNEALSRMGYGGLPGLFKNVNRLNYMAGGGMVPAAPKRFAAGGTLSYGQLEGLWDRAGGAPNMAPLMAAIALAESGGNPSIVNSIGASGLWQIHPGEPGDLDPLTNARIAVRKLRDQGLVAWETYTNGAYRQFLHGGVPAIGGAIEKIARQLISGPAGAAKDLAQGGADWGRKRINDWLAKHAPTGGGISTAGITGAGGLGSFDGLQVANWIIPILNWAQGHGWAGRITSGFRPGAITNSGNVSNHAKASYPGGAVDVGDQHAITQGEALWNVVKSYPGSPKLYSAAFGPGAWGPYKDSPHDYGHFSATGRARGGFVRGFAGGGLPGAVPGLNAPWGSWIKGHPTWLTSHHRPKSIAQWVNPVVTALGHLTKKHKVQPGAAGALSKLEAKIRHLKLPSVAAHATAASHDSTKQEAAATLIPTDAIVARLTGPNADTSWYDPNDVTNINLGREQQIIASMLPSVQGRNALEWLNLELGDQVAYRNALIYLHRTIDSQLKVLGKALKNARDRLTTIRSDITKLNTAIRKKVSARNDLLAKLHPKGKHAKAPTKAEAKHLNDQIKAIDDDKSSSGLKPMQDRLASLEAERTGLTRADTGLIPVLNTKIGDLRTADGSDDGDSSTALGALYALQGPVIPSLKFAHRQASDILSAAPGRWLGDIFTTLNSIRGFYGQFLQTPPTPDTTTATTPGADQFSFDLQRLGLERDAVGALQRLVLQGAGIPYGGSFADGGQVPGPPGAPRVIVAHGREWVVPENQVGKSGDTFVFVDGKGTPLADFIDVRIERASRASTGPAIRGLPGRGGR